MSCACRVDSLGQFICAAHFQMILAIARRKNRCIEDVIWMMMNGRKK